MMKKFEIMPKVMVYQDILDGIPEILEVLKRSETDSSLYQAPLSGESITTDNHGVDPVPYNHAHVIRKWVPWYEFGTRSSINPEPESSEDPTYLEQSAVRDKLFAAVDTAIKEYAKEWASLDWPDYVGKWEFRGVPESGEDRSKLIFGSLDILKHNYNLERDYALPFHTDYHNQKAEAPGYKPVITVTIYLNDDYDDGEIQFASGEINKLITYKPKAGDITIFPSIKPYWHSALPVKNSYKYLLRSFIVSKYDGSQEWHDNLNKYGQEKWDEIENNRILKEADDGKYGIYVTSDPEAYSRNIKEEIIFIRDEDNMYIDGHDIG